MDKVYDGFSNKSAYSVAVTPKAGESWTAFTLAPGEDNSISFSGSPFTHAETNETEYYISGNKVVFYNKYIWFKNNSTYTISVYKNYNLLKTLSPGDFYQSTLLSSSESSYYNLQYSNSTLVEPSMAVKGTIIFTDK